MNPRIALAVLAAATILIQTAPADARRVTKAPAAATPVFDVAAVPAYPTVSSRQGSYEDATFLPHPDGCPRRAFCACGAAVKIFGQAKRNLWPVRAWRQFARDVAAPGNVAIERGRSHLFVLVSHVSGNDWLVDDFNSGGHRSRRHVRSVGNTIIVNPQSSRYADHAGSRL